MKIVNPTGDGNGGTGSWVIASSMLSCGLNILQGWSSGHGIAKDNADKFEERMFALTYLSGNINHSDANYWYSRAISGDREANIGVPRQRYQFLSSNQNYLISSEEHWVKRFEEFIKAYDLGDFSTTDTVVNSNYLGHKIKVGLWRWNGKWPQSDKFSHLFKD